MGQGDQVEHAAIAAQSEGAAYDFVELLEWKKLRDRKFSDRDDEPWTQQIDFIIHPGRAIPNFIRRRNPIAAGGRFAWKTPADGGEVNLRTHLGLGQLAKFLKPTEESPAGSPSEWLAQDRLFHAGCLAD